MERRILEPAEGNPFFLEELVRSLVDAGALVHDERGLAVRPRGRGRDPADRREGDPRAHRPARPGAHDALIAAAVLGRQFGLPLLEAVVGADGRRRAAVAHELQRVDLVREGRRWPEPEYRFKHALIQEAAYRTLVAADRSACTDEAAEWLEARYAGREDEVAGLLAHHWLAADDEDKAVAYLTNAGDRARQEYALDEAIGHYRELLPILERRGERQRDRARPVQARARAAHVAAVRGGERDVPAGLRVLGAAGAVRHADGGGRRWRRASCRTIPTRARRSRGPTSSSACSCSTGWWSSGPSARSCRRSPSGGRSPTTACATCSTSARG